MSCLFSLGFLVTLMGVIFVYGGTSERFKREDVKTLRWLQCFCGPEFMPNVTIAFTKWDSYSADDFEINWLKVPGLLDEPVIATILKHGGSLYHHGIPGGQGSHHLAEMPERTLSNRRHKVERRTELQKLIRRRNTGKKPPKLQVLREAKTLAAWKQTEAAKVLMADVNETEVVIRGNRAVVVPKRDLVEPAIVAGPLPQGEGGETDKKKGDGPKKSEEIPKKSDSEPSAARPEKNKTRNQAPKPEEQTGWGARIIGWLEVAREVAKFFKEARSAAAAGRGEEVPKWSIFGTLKKWFFA